MQASINSSIPDRCCCCLSESKHQHKFGDVHIKMLQKCLNLILTHGSRTTPMICTTCVSFLKDAQRFREMVISSHEQLYAECKDEPECFESYQAGSQTDSNIADGTVKLEIESDNYLDSTLSLKDQKDESDELKRELESSPGYNSDWEPLEDTELKTEPEQIKSNSKRKRRLKDGKSDLKNYEEYDSESDTPISQIKLKKTKLKKKIEKGTPISKVKIKKSGQKKEMGKQPKILTHSNSESKQQSFIDNNKVRSNISLILKYSTVLPFRNNFKSTFKCFYCDKLYIPFKELKEHIETEHSDVSETIIGKIVRSMPTVIVTADISCIKCRLCDEEFKSIENLVEHLSNIHEKVYYEADKKPSHGILGVDLSTDALKCHICNKDFAFFKNLSVHMNEHYGSFVCYICGKKFLSEHRYKCHLFKAHANKDTQCKHCGKTFSTEPAMAYHVGKEHLKRMIKCLKCPVTFSLGQYGKRLNHMADVHGIKKPVFKCDTCGREYANSGSLAAHRRYTHKRTKEHKCEICGYITVHNGVMKNHMDVHNGVKNYQCEFCRKKFAKPYTLKLHLKIHLNDKSFVCSLCDAAFIQKNSLKSHLKSRHPDSGIDISKL